ncbi:hypothetical protein L596_021395 [Steinernema carpocapsae]|uniref:MARVEL domain-containing protein n=1 Tax=Steinernema carpocapsae TaxID=34508 RepID=A0A4U5MIN8_STECR|nr:hypothetical protein L596_021395 [Steinernema carpocapsae]
MAQEDHSLKFCGIIPYTAAVLAIGVSDLIFGFAGIAAIFLFGLFGSKLFQQCLLIFCGILLIFAVAKKSAMQLMYFITFQWVFILFSAFNICFAVWQIFNIHKFVNNHDSKLWERLTAFGKSEERQARALLGIYIAIVFALIVYGLFAIYVVKTYQRSLLKPKQVEQPSKDPERFQQF